MSISLKPRSIKISSIQYIHISLLLSVRGSNLKYKPFVVSSFCYHLSIKIKIKNSLKYLKKFHKLRDINLSTRGQDRKLGRERVYIIKIRRAKWES
jgi:hypothetical protein